MRREEGREEGRDEGRDIVTIALLVGGRARPVQDGTSHDPQAQ